MSEQLLGDLAGALGWLRTSREVAAIGTQGVGRRRTAKGGDILDREPPSLHS